MPSSPALPPPTSVLTFLSSRGPVRRGMVTPSLPSSSAAKLFLVKNRICVFCNQEMTKNYERVCQKFWSSGPEGPGSVCGVRGRQHGFPLQHWVVFFKARQLKTITAFCPHVCVWEADIGFLGCRAQFRVHGGDGLCVPSPHQEFPVAKALSSRTERSVLL